MRTTIDLIKLPVKNNIMGEIIRHEIVTSNSKLSISVTNTEEYIVAIFNHEGRNHKYYFGKTMREIKELKNCMNDFFVNPNLVV